MSTVKSQLVNLPSVNAPAPKAPVFALARFVAGDIKGGSAAHAFRVETMTQAIEQAFKGNADPIKEASTLANGKAKKARAWHAGFAAVQTEVLPGGDKNPVYCMARVQYKGALTLPENKAARDMIADKTHHAAIAFFAAYDAIMAEKPAPKAVKEVAAVVPVEVVQPAPAIEEEDAADMIELTVESAVDTMLTLIKGGMLNQAELALLNAALCDAADVVDVPFVSAHSMTDAQYAAH